MASYEAKKKITSIAAKESAPSSVEASPRIRKSSKSKDNDQSSPSKKFRSKDDSTNDLTSMLP